MMLQSVAVQNLSAMFISYHGYFYYQLSYLVYMLPAIILTLIAQCWVKSSYSKYSSIRNTRGITGEMAARMVLNAHGISNVRIESIKGKMTDHYSPKENVIRLSEGVYSSATIAAVSIAAHEAGHAVQHAEGYMPNKIRSSVIPVANISSKMAVPVILIGIIFSDKLAILGIVLYSLAILVYLVTLPVEFDASRRALATIRSSYMLETSEYAGARTMLTAAAMTYVASALGALLNFLRLLLIVLGNRGRRN